MCRATCIAYIYMYMYGCIHAYTRLTVEPGKRYSTMPLSPESVSVAAGLNMVVPMPVFCGGKMDLK